MTKTKETRDLSEYVCAHCGLGVSWRTHTWQHNTNRYTGKGCGKPPKPEARMLYEIRMQTKDKP